MQHDRMPSHPLVDWPIVRALGRQRYLALSLLAYLFSVPFTSQHTDMDQLLNFGVLTLVFITGPLAVARTRLTLSIAFLLALLVLLPGLASTAGEFDAAYPYYLIAGIAFSGFLAVLIFRELLVDASKVDSETLWAAVNVYVLIGVCFAFWYAAISLFDPGQFTGKFMDQPLGDQMIGFIYFSFVTLTTLGYGDITPNGHGAATLTYLEALIGQLHIAIMMARLVGLYIARRQ